MAGEATPTLNWGDVLSTTLMAYIDSGMLHDQVFTSTAFLNWLRSGSRIRKVNGGDRIKVGLLHRGPGNYKRYSGDEVLDITQQPGRTVAFFNWKQASAAAVISGLEQRVNGGESAVRDLAKDRIRAAELEIADNLTTDAFSNGSANSSKQVTGLLAMLPDDPTAANEYADIDPSVNTAWQNQAITGVGSGAVNLLPNLRTLHNDCQEGSAGVRSAPDAIFCPQAIHEIAEAVVQPAIRYAGGGGKGEMSINPMFRGAEFKWDEHCQAQTLYMLNSNHIFLFVHKQADLAMAPEGFQRPVNQDSYTAQILFQGNMGTNNRRKLGKMTGIT